MKFCKLFIFDDEADKDDDNKEKLFARSFVQDNWKDFKKHYLGGNEVCFGVDFAWSSWSCLIDGYPTKNKKENPEGFGNCVTLEWACKEYEVYVEIETYETGMCFEEKIIADKNGVSYDSWDMPTHKCHNCGSEQAIPSSCDLEEESCYECETEGAFVDKLQKMFERRIENR